MKLVAVNLQDAWFQSLYNLVDYDEKTNEFKNATYYSVQQGSYKGAMRLEYPYIVIEIVNPTHRPLLPEIPEHLNLPPLADMEYVYRYFIDYMMSSEIAKNEQYTYGSRINTVVSHTEAGEPIYQLDLLHQRLIEHPYSNQLVLQIAEPNDITLSDPPCYRSIQFKVIDNKLDFHIHFRSNHLWSGFPVNMAATVLLMEYCCISTQFNPGKLIYFGSGLHLYEHDFKNTERRLQKGEKSFNNKTLKEALDDLEGKELLSIKSKS